MTFSRIILLYFLPPDPHFKPNAPDHKVIRLYIPYYRPQGLLIENDSDAHAVGKDAKVGRAMETLSFVFFP